MSLRAFIFLFVINIISFESLKAEEPATEAVATKEDDRSRPPKVFFKNGVYADAFTDFSVQSLTLLEESTLQLAVKAGWQLIGNEYISLAGGYGVSSLGSLNNKAKDYKRYSLSYHGPLGELQIMPSSFIYGVLTGYAATGSFKLRKEKEDPTSEAKFKVGEVSAGVFVRFKYYLHAGIQAGQHQISYSDREFFEQKNASSSFVSLSIRGSTL